MGIPASRDWDDELTKARAALNWQQHFDLSFDPDTARALHDEDLDVDTEFCAMCGHDWCSVRISKEIQEFVSGKDQQYAWENAKVSAALTIEQKEILQNRGVLSPKQIHALATKTNRTMTGAAASAASDSSGPAKLSCHSDYVDDESAKKMQEDAAI